MAMDRKKSHLSSKKIRNQDTMSSRERILYSLTEFSIKKESRETMQYTTHYQSPLGDLLLAADDEGLTGIWFEGSANYADGLELQYEENETPILKKAREWLDVYFSGREPDFLPPIHMTGTPFQLSVWEILQKIPYGKTMTYKEIAEKIAQKEGHPSSAQAVGGALARNRWLVLIPCHRVVGTDGSLTGYAGGMDRKVELLKLEKADLEHLWIPNEKTEV